MNHSFLLLLLCTVDAMADRLSAFVRHYEPLSYGTEDGGRYRVKRSTHTSIRFNALNRNFHLILRPDRSAFAEDFIAKDDQGIIDLDLSHIHVGRLAGDPGSRVFGSVMQGKFEGHIATGDGSKFYVEPAWKYFDSDDPVNHSVIYSARDVELPADVARTAGCGINGLHQNETEATKRQTQPRSHPKGRRKREADYAEPPGIPIKDEQRGIPRNSSSSRRIGGRPRRLCHLEIVVDHTMYAAYTAGGASSSTARARIAATVASHVDAVSIIYSSTNFGGITGVKFIVLSLTIHGTKSCRGRNKATNPLCKDALDASDVLHIFSLKNHDDFCLSFIWVYRDFTEGTLGLAYLGRLGEGSGGLCSKYMSYKARRATLKMSLNTGVITFINHGAVVSPVISQITFAHEIGHAFGAEHDAGLECAPDGQQGNFIMFPKATAGTLRNNRRFSKCSIKSITEVLRAVIHSRHEKENCFLSSEGPFCGNNIREGAEECDCGYSDADCKDRCCYASKNSNNHEGCKLRPNAACSPTAGVCCSTVCSFLSTSVKCLPEDRCNFASFCDSVSASCPPPRPKRDLTPCNKNTQVCIKGHCEGSICLRYGYQDCQLSGHRYSADDMCTIRCRTNTSTKCLNPCHVRKLRALCNRKKQPGTACNNNNGYCDLFHKCRGVDEQGPLSRLESIFEPTGWLRRWVEDHIWAVPVAIVAGVASLLLFIRCCAVFTPSSNPTHRPALTIRQGIHNPDQVLFTDIIHPASKLVSR